MTVSQSGKVRVLESERALSKELQSIAGQVNSIQNGLRYNIASSRHIAMQMRTVSSQLTQEADAVGNLHRGLEQIFSLYEQTEQRNIQAIGIKGGTSSKGGPVSTQPDSMWEDFKSEFIKSFGISELLAGSNYIGKLYDIYTGFKDADGVGGTIKSGKDLFDFLKGARQTYKNYKRIGNAVGSKKAMTWWAKNAVGLKPLGRASSAKHFFTRFKNNLTNKTSPFNAEIKNQLGNFAGKNGTGKAVASWAGVLLSGAINYAGNREEQAEVVARGESMSDGRVLAETIMETTIDTVVSVAGRAVVGAAVTAALGTVAAPGLLVTAVSGLAIAGINAGVRALTGKSATEWASDAILDAGEAVGKAVGKTAKKVKDTVSGWFGKLSFA